MSLADLSNLDDILASLAEKSKVITNAVPKIDTLPVETMPSTMFNHSAEYVFYTLKIKKLALSALINDNSSNVFVNEIADFKLVLFNNTESLKEFYTLLFILI
jgi:hypothetical protein